MIRLSHDKKELISEKKTPASAGGELDLKETICSKNRRMKKMRFRQTTAAAAAAFLMTAGCILPVTSVSAAYQYEPAAGGTVEFDKYLVMDQEAEIPNVSFTYSITPGKAQVYEKNGSVIEISEGVGQPLMKGVGTSEDYTISFSAGDGSDDEAARSSQDTVKNFNPDTSGYAKKTAVVDFSPCLFTEPGIYRYVITEEGSNQAVTNDSVSSRILDVYVLDKEGSLEVQAYVFHEASEDAAAAAESQGSKSAGFTNVYDTSNLTIRKQVTGNQASRNKYFAFTLEIRDAVPGTVYPVDLTEADEVTEDTDSTKEEYRGKKNPSVLTAGEDGTLRQVFYLQHGQQITVQGIATETSYSVTEDSENYVSTANTAESPSVTAEEGTISADTEGIILQEDLTTGYLNGRNGIIPTGLVMNAGPLAGITLLGAAGAAAVIVKRRKESGRGEGDQP